MGMAMYIFKYLFAGIQMYTRGVQLIVNVNDPVMARRNNGLAQKGAMEVLVWHTGELERKGEFDAG